MRENRHLNKSPFRYGDARAGAAAFTELGDVISLKIAIRRSLAELSDVIDPILVRYNGKNEQ